MRTKTLITGGAGFIGSHLAEYLSTRGRHLVLIDDLSSGQRANVDHLLGEHCQLIEATAGEAINHSLLADVSEIYHLAAAVGVKRVVENPQAMIQNNVEQTAAVLAAAADTGVPVLVASSSEVYGKCPVLPLREDMELVYGPTTAPRWAYGLTKALDEHLAIDFYRRHHLPVVIVRLFNTIGPRQTGRHGMVVPRFVRWAAANEPVGIYGDGTQTRSFCDVRDVVQALPRLLGSVPCHGKVYNLGSDQRHTIDQLAELVIAACGSSGGKRYVPYADVYGSDFEDPPHRVPDLTRVNEAIGFSATIDLPTTVAQLVKAEQAPSTHDCAAPTKTPIAMPCDGKAQGAAH